MQPQQPPRPGPWPPQQPVYPTTGYPHQQPYQPRPQPPYGYGQQLVPMPPPIQYAPPKPQHVSGLSTGGHIMMAILTVFTCGLAAPIWALVAFLGRRRIS